MGFRKVRRGETAIGLISMETAEAYRVAGRLDEALPLLEQTLSHDVQRFGSCDPGTSTVRVYLAAAYQQAGRVHDAISLFETALADTERMLGADHPNTLACRTKPRRRIPGRRRPAASGGDAGASPR
jgi:tetratricopeptide (TPR) repeat protein